MCGGETDVSRETYLSLIPSVSYRISLQTPLLFLSESRTASRRYKLSRLLNQEAHGSFIRNFRSKDLSTRKHSCKLEASSEAIAVPEAKETVLGLVTCYISLAVF